MRSINVEKMVKDGIFNIVMAAIIITSLWMMITGHRVLWIATESMVPTLKVHQLVLAEEAKAEDLSVGDIATYKVPGKPYTITHRIVKDEGDAFIFKGDNNNVCDEPVSKDWVVYKIVKY